MTTHRFKCVVLGDSGVGKTSLLTRFVKEEFRSTAGSRSTISAALLERSVELDDGSIVELEIWDTAGQERFRSLNTPMYYRGAAGAILCYDCCDEDSWKHIPGWYSQLCMMGERNCVVALCASKLDLAIQGKRKISAETASDFVKKEAIRVFRETSAKTGENVEPLFVALATAMVTQAAKTTADVQSNTNNLRLKNLSDANENRRPNSACC
mmetsp:Transcript_22441/g.29090  ORF Transcript_22441/g.29090 Transcript_22441/m.29090 type:complete len:211 (-) Transcript_22441:275-907(-)|eukprot:CAMPEP_0197312192 /NCGR_PEP_ID=MMETSP0891-20130614/18646_1 /TAXON_ID=44058 ORGANISM="Aureoumbra lagunensis, Strain CCMP1510" /NCGR_SAMPLE_ID=MMETSP0891 /ASSEMBLY_ACC=CAM_ASM_000534 /LENGTH=210 /DNA_ID=CAMNT_0042799113 /DNA_START=17 /DNA_END=649 /DNA_ORIENTATION=+